MRRIQTPPTSVKQLICAAALVLAWGAGLAAESSGDPLLDSLTTVIGGEASSLPESGDMVIGGIDIRITGSTDPAWVRTQLLFGEGDRFTPEAWQEMVKHQTALLQGTSLFYQVRIYAKPGPDGKPAAVIELTDGFMYGFGFWPWDLSVGFKHLLGGQDRLDLTLGLNTQAAAWSHPFVSGSPFGYAAGIGHSLGYQKPGWLLESLDANAEANLSIGPWLRMAAELRFKSWTLPLSSWLEPELLPAQVQATLSGLGISGPGTALEPGLSLVLWPQYQFQSPLGITARFAGGAILPLDSTTPGWYASAQALALWRPIDQLVIHGRWILDGRFGPVSPVLFPDSARLRSPEWLAPQPWFSLASLQVTGARLLSFGLGFTSLSFSPFAYIEAGETIADLGQWSFSRLHGAVGGGVAVELGPPINLIFSFGIKAGLTPGVNPGFLFSVDSNLY